MKEIIDDLKQEGYTRAEIIKYGIIVPVALGLLTILGL
jgi:hypothetical protein